MSHQPERKHKNCLNCGVMVKGRFCQRCGQENIVTKQSFWAIIKHFVFDIFHFDGKFFDTLKMLFAKPGRVPLEYTSGKRMKYLDPVRMYLFTSALFFLIFFSIRDIQPIKTGYDGYLSKSERLDAVMELNERDLKDSLHPVEKLALAALMDSSLIIHFNRDTNELYDSTIYFKGKPYRLATKKDSTWYTPPADGKSWISRMLENKTRKIVRENRDDPDRAFKSIGTKLYHRLPYMLFLSLPFFALILKLIYGRKKEVYYSDHIAFTLYHYIFSFLLLLLLTGFVEAYNSVKLTIFLWLLAAGALYWLYYLYRGLRVFYRQGRIKTIIKFILLNVLSVILFIILVILFALFSFIEF